MRRLTPGAPLNDLTGCYGPTWRQGVLSDHLGYVGDDVRIVTSPSGARTYAVDRHGDTYPVLCSEIVAIRTEDGVIDGRCGDYVVDGGPRCEGHTFVLDFEREGAYA